MELVSVLLFMPWVAAALLFLNGSQKWQYLIVSMAFVTLSGASFILYDGYSVPYASYFSHTLDLVFVAADVILLLFFVAVGLYYRDRRVALLALLQLLLYGWAEMSLGISEGAALMVDRLSVMMFLVINGVGGVIVFYAVRYMRDEGMSNFRKRLFSAYLLLFLSVMNTLVIANSLLLFFFLFEMTTLASYLLIAFRDDEVSRRNALRALWMNQIGGVVILLGTLIAIGSFETVYFDVLMSRSGGYLLAAVALLSMAALVKGASMPFDSWLLGAMVAPTPVSAMLHSATMVKIAPFMILKFASLLGGTLLGGVISLFGSMVFVAAAYFALSRVVFKEILGLSTIAMLGLMMSLAALGSEESVQIVMLLIVFHALSKALLFLAAGSVEKLHHRKDVEAMKGLVEIAPKNVFFIIFGFISMILPPFGIFMGKLFALQLVAENLMSAPWQIVLLMGIIGGGVLLALLYFKVVSALLARTGDPDAIRSERLSYGFGLPLALLSVMIVTVSVALVLHHGNVPLWFLLAAALLLAAVPWFYGWVGRFDRTVEYHCGEKERFDAALFYFQIGGAMKRRIYWLFGALFFAVAVAGVLS